MWQSGSGMAGVLQMNLEAERGFTVWLRIQMGFI